MRICLVSTGYPIANQAIVSGLYAANQTLARGLASAGHEVHVVTFSGEEDWDDDGASIHHIRRPNLHYYLGKVPLLGERTTRAVRELEISHSLCHAVFTLDSSLKFDVVESAEDGSVGMGLLDRRMVTIIRLHGDDYTFLQHTPGIRVPSDYRLCRVFQRIGLRNARHLVSPSIAHADEIAREINRDRADISVIPHDLPAWWPIGHDPVVEDIVLWVGRLERRKGIIDALRGFRGVLDARPEARLVVIGSAHRTVDPKLVAQEIDRLNLKRNIQMIGSMPHNQIISWYKRARIFLFPTYYETFGLVALEAMACGLPVVGYRAGAVPEIVEDKHTGLLVEPGDTTGLAASMLRLISDDAVWNAMSQASIQSIDQYRHSRAITATESVYTQLLGRP
jgi:glycosyltransferase involved in cell wall biosynthesis